MSFWAILPFSWGDEREEETVFCGRALFPLALREISSRHREGLPLSAEEVVLLGAGSYFLLIEPLANNRILRVFESITIDSTLEQTLNFKRSSARPLNNHQARRGRKQGLHQGLT